MGKIKDFFSKKSFKYGSYSIISIAVVIAIVIVVNLLVGMAGVKLDLTSAKIFSLGSESTKIIKSIGNKDVTIYGLFDPNKLISGDESKKIVDLLAQYAKYPNIKVKYVDVDKEPGFIKTIDPTNQMKLQSGDYVVLSGKKTRAVSSSELLQVNQNQYTGQQEGMISSAEQTFTGAIKYVTAEVNPTVYFTQGHGEKDVTTDYTIVKQYLERNNYDVKTINLFSESKVPSDAAILIVASPQSDLSADEKGKIKAFLDNGGKAVFMIDPIQGATQLPNFESLLDYYNIGLNYDMVKENDATRHVNGQDYDIVPDLQPNDVNAPLGGNLVTIMPSSRSLKLLKNQKDWLTNYELMVTSNQSEGIQMDQSKGPNNPGPLDLAIAAQVSGDKGAKVLVIGNGSFITDSAINQYQQYSVNGLYFFLNSLNWLQGDKNDVAIQPKVYDATTVMVTQSTANILSILLMAVLPLLILALGTVVWLRRRHL